jgi:glyoxylase-like metal-dependent hydrolase (beta-lactamase superfamily II)
MPPRIRFLQDTTCGCNYWLDPGIPGKSPPYTEPVPEETAFYFRQLLAGRDYAVGDELAGAMANFVYLIGDRRTREVVVVDPAYDPAGLVEVIEGEGLVLTGVLVTHYHADHVGGSLMGHEISGLAELLERVSVRVHVQRHERPWVSRSTGVAPSELVAHDDGDRVAVGSLDVELLHTPGHTPGSQCFLVHLPGGAPGAGGAAGRVPASGGLLVSGDTLFLQGCGRTDLPGSNADAMYDSLRRLAGLPDDLTVFPGHHYSPSPSADLGTVRSTNVALRPLSRQEWRARFAP